MKKTSQRDKCSKERIFIFQLKKLKCIVEGEPFDRTVWRKVMRIQEAG